MIKNLTLLADYQTAKGRNRVDLYQFNYNLKMKNARKLGQSAKSLTQQYTDEIRKYLIEYKRDVLQSSFMDKSKRMVIRDIIKTYILDKELVVPELPGESLLNMILDDISGFGLIQSLIEDPDVTDIYVNGTRDIRYEKEGREYTFSSRYERKEDVESLAYKIANTAGQKLSIAKPDANCRFPFLRFNIILDTLSDIGTLITIRKASSKLRATEERMLSTNQATRDMLDLMTAIVKAKLKILIVGETGSGKTELLKYLASHIPNNERTLVVEDTAELFLHLLYPEKHIICTECRFTDDEETTIDYSRLLKNALRQNPKRLIVGESRGKEAIQMLQFFNTGHSGATTIHSESAVKAMDRLVEMCQESGTTFSDESLYRLVTSAFDLVIVQKKREDGNRYIQEISEILGYEKGQVIINPLYHFEKISEEINSEGEVIKIHGQHVNDNPLSPQIVKKLRNATVDKALYERFIATNDEVKQVV